MSKKGPYILVIDDELEIVRSLRRSLVAHGYTVQTANTGEDALKAISQRRPDLLLLDLLMPGIGGLEVCRQVRQVSNTPIIVLSVKGAERDKVEALDLGADDYVAKPFGMNEVLARVRVALRRLAQPTREGSSSLFQSGSLSVDFARRRVLLNEREVSLTPTEFGLLRIFITHQGKILTRHMLMNQLWGDQEYERTHSLHVYVAQLRQKIEPIPSHPRFILTIPGVGYRFTDEQEG